MCGLSYHYSLSPFMSLRESLLTREIEGYKRELMTKTDKLNVAIKSNSEVCTLRWRVLTNMINECKFLLIGVSLSEPHVDRKASPRPINYLSMLSYVIP